LFTEQSLHLLLLNNNTAKQNINKRAKKKEGAEVLDEHKNLREKNMTKVIFSERS
jgi:hypothetical protein